MATVEPQTLGGTRGSGYCKPSPGVTQLTQAPTAVSLSTPTTQSMYPSNQSNELNQRNVNNDTDSGISNLLNDGDEISSQINTPPITGTTPSETPVTVRSDDSDTSSRFFGPSGVSGVSLQSTNSNNNSNNNSDINNSTNNDKPIIKKQKSKKPIPTKSDCNSVREHYKYAQQRDIEDVLKNYHEHLITYRNKIYSNSRKNGINEYSSVATRLDIIGQVVQYCFFNIEPPNDYTAKTDRKHFREVAVLGVRFWKKHYPTDDLPASLVIACWLHDIERFIPETKCKYLAESVDKYRKQLIHPLTSAKVAMALLNGAPVTEAERKRVWELVIHHDKPIDANIVLEGEELLSVPPVSITKELQILMDADSFAFFQSTIYLFVVFKAKKNSKEWIWERVFTNVKRLRPHLRRQASRSILDLPQHIQSKIAINNNYLQSINTQKDDNITNKLISQQQQPQQQQQQQQQQTQQESQQSQSPNDKNNNNNNTKNVSSSRKRKSIGEKELLTCIESNGDKVEDIMEKVANVNMKFNDDYYHMIDPNNPDTRIKSESKTNDIVINEKNNSINNNNENNGIRNIPNDKKRKSSEKDSNQGKRQNTNTNTNRNINKHETMKSVETMNDIDNKHNKSLEIIHNHKNSDNDNESITIESNTNTTINKINSNNNDIKCADSSKAKSKEKDRNIGTINAPQGLTQSTTHYTPKGDTTNNSDNNNNNNNNIAVCSSSSLKDYEPNLSNVLETETIETKETKTSQNDHESNSLINEQHNSRKSKKRKTAETV